MKKILFILLIIFSTGFSTESYAAPNRAGLCKPSEFGSAEVWSISMRAATCTKAFMLTVVDNAYNVLEEPAKAILAVVLLLSVTLFGAKLAGGMIQQQNVMGEMLLFGLKAAIATYLIANYEDFYEIPFDLLDTLINVSTGWININFSSELNDVCVEYLGDSSKYSNDPLLKTWWDYDCMGLIALGYLGNAPSAAVGAAGASFLVKTAIAITSAFMLVTLIFFFPVFGLLILFSIVAFIFTIFATIFKGIIIYVRTVIILSLLVIMLPIFLPFMFFSYTKTYYDQLVEIILETIFQPVVFFVIIGMFMMILIGNSNDQSPFNRYWDSLQYTTSNATFESVSVGDSDQLGTITKVTASSLTTEDKYNLISSILGTLILSAAMLAFAQNSETIAATMFTTPGNSVGSTWDALAPSILRKGTAGMGNKLDKYMNKLGSGQRGQYNRQAFDNLNKNTQKRLDSINKRDDLTDWQKSKERRAVYKDAQKQEKSMEKANKRTGILGTFNTECKEWVRKDTSDIEKHLDKNLSGLRKDDKYINKKLETDLAKLEKAPIGEQQRRETGDNLRRKANEKLEANQRTRNSMNKGAANEINKRNAAYQKKVSEGTAGWKDTTIREKMGGFKERIFNGAKSDINKDFLRGDQ